MKYTTALLFFGVVATTHAQRIDFDCYTLGNRGVITEKETLEIQACYTDQTYPDTRCLADDQLGRYGCQPIGIYENIYGGNCTLNNVTTCCTTDLCNTNSTLIQNYLNNPNKDALSACYHTDYSEPHEHTLIENVYIREGLPQRCAWYTATCQDATQITFGDGIDCGDNDDDVVVIGIGYVDEVRCNILKESLNVTAPPGVVLIDAECCTTRFCLPSFAPPEFFSTTAATTTTLGVNTATSNATTNARQHRWAKWIGVMLGLGTYALLVINIF